MKKKVVAGLTSIILAVVLIFGGVTFYNNHQQKKFEKQMASFESVDTMKHPKESTIKIDGVEVPLSSAPKVTTKTTTKKSTKIQKLKKKASKSKVTTIRKTKTASEYFAESYRDYRENPTALKSKRPRTYQFVKKTINGISDSDVQEIKDTYGEYWGL